MIKQFREAHRKLRRAARFLNNRFFRLRNTPLLERPRAGISDIGHALRAGKPFAAGKIGGTELRALEFWDRRFRLPWPPRWGWGRPAERLMLLSGFFPVEKKHFIDWRDTMRRSISEIDFLCEWQTDDFLQFYENNLIKILTPRSHNIAIEDLGRPLVPVLLPFRWLVVSPFALSIEKQLPKLRLIHDPGRNQDGEWQKPAQTCQIIRCPFYSHLEKSPYTSWQSGLDHLFNEISARDFDVALIGAGAWSLPLAAKIKATGRSAIHLGGDTQLLFGIKGKRWDRTINYTDGWISPDRSEMPHGRTLIEDGCYW